MNAGGDAAEQIVRFYLEGFEVMAKLSGKGAERVIALLLNVIKDHKQTKGKARLNTMLKSGKPLSIFTINRKDLKKFATKAKEYGVLYSALMNKLDKSPDGLVDIMVRAEDASKINRIVERFKLTISDDVKIETEVKKGLDEKGLNREGKVVTEQPSKEEKKPNEVEKVGLNKTPSIPVKKEEVSVVDNLTDIKLEMENMDSNKSHDQKAMQRDIRDRKIEKDKILSIQKQDIDTRNFSKALTGKENLLEPDSKTSKVIDITSSNTTENRQSVRKDLANIKKEMDLKDKQELSKNKGKVNISKSKNNVSKSKTR